MGQRITEAAILQDGKVYTGRRHHLIIADIVRETNVRPVKGEQGFVTDTGRFVSREEAGKIALACGQIEKLKYHRTKLFSEDLY